MLPGDFKVGRSIVIDASGEVYPWVGGCGDGTSGIPGDMSIKSLNGATRVIAPSRTTRMERSSIWYGTLDYSAPKQQILRINMAEATLEHDRLIVFELEDLGGQTRLRGVSRVRIA